MLRNTSASHASAPSPLGGPRRVSTRALILRPQIIPALCLLLVGLAVFWGVNRNAGNARLAADAQSSLTQVETVLSDVIDFETGERGFLITGDDRFLEPYRNALQQFPRHVAPLLARHQDVATAADRVHLAQIRRVQRLVAAWRREVGEPEIAARRRGLAEAVALARGGRGKQLIDEVRRVLAQYREQEGRRQAALARDGEATLAQVRLIVVLGLLAALAALLVTSWRTARVLSGVFEVLSGASRRIAAGHLGERVPDSRVAEVAEFSHHFNVMAGSLQRREDELRATVEELARANDDLTRSNAELEQFAYVASHDLQAPLRSVTSFTELLERRLSGQLDERAKLFMRQVKEGAIRMKLLIDDLLLFSRVTRTEGASGTANAEEVLANVLRDLASVLHESNAVVTHDPLPTVRLDASQLGQVLQNLIANGVKYRDCARPPRVHVSAASKDGTVRFSVRDNGIGIEAQYYERIFLVFQRLHRNEDIGGTGIGLAICKKIVERGGGRIWLESVPGEGSTFFFSLPAA